MKPAPQLRFGGPVTLSQQIADWLAEAIEDGEYQPDAEPLPSESQLLQEFPVSRDTVRRAIQILREAGLIYTVPHVGTFVPRSAVRAGRR